MGRFLGRRIFRRMIRLSMIMLSSSLLQAGEAELSNDPALTHLYTFAEGKGLRTRNLQDNAPFSDMVIAGRGVFAGGEKQDNEDYPRWVDGRRPGTSALSIGTTKRRFGSIGCTHFYGVEGKNFSVAMWVRVPDGTAPVVFASVGNGYSNGWRINRNGSGVDFVLGREPGAGAGKGIVVATAPDCLRSHVWQQFVAVLNDSRLQLFVDGKLAGEQEFDGIYRHPETPAVRHQKPELDTRGGLQLGATASQKHSSRFDIDELAIYSRALEAAEVAKLYTAGKPELSPEEQITQHKAELARQKQLDGITIELPKDTFGYFPNDQEIPVTITVDQVAAPLFAKAGSVDIGVARFQGEALAKETLPLALSDAGTGKVEYVVKPDRCGLYVLDMAVRDNAGQILKTLRVDFARRLPLPPREQISDASMLASYVGLHHELPAFGTKVERIIQPIYGRAADGGANFAASDAFVDTCVSMGLDVLYCINIGFWEDGNYKTVADWKADPTIHTDHIRNLATRYKGKVKYWEIFNEPNAHGFKPEDYVELLKQAHAIFKEIDSEAKIVGPCGTSSYHDWTEAVLAAGGGPYFDILSFHNYISMSPLKNHELGRVTAVKKSMREHIGRELPMWNSECGLHQPERIDGRPATDEELLKIYGGRARRDADGVKVGVDAIMMVNEHLSACWQAQSMLVERAEGIRKYFMLMRPSQPYPQFSPGDEFVTEKGVALVAAQSLLMKAVDARFIPTNVTGATCIGLVDNEGKSTVALFADQPVSLVFKTGLGADSPIKAMDFLGNPREFQADANGLLTLTLTAEPIYLLDVPQAFAVNAEGVTLTCDINQLEPMSRVEVIAEVRNPFDRAVKAMLEPTVSAGVATVATKEFELAPGESRNIAVVWQTGNMEKGRHWMRGQLRLNGDFFSVIENGAFFSHGKMTRVHRFPGTFTLDGNSEKWADIPAENADSRDQAVIGRPVEGAPNPMFWSGTEDLSYTFKTAWSDDAIHFLVEVTDDVLRPPMNADEDKSPWHFDGLELFVDARPRSERQTALTAGAVQAVVAPRMDEAIADCPVRIFGKEPLPVTVRCVSRKTKSGYLVEGTITPVAASPLMLKDGMQINLDVSVDDNDDQPDQEVKLGRRIQMALHGTANNHVETSNYGRYILSDESIQANLIKNGDFRTAELLAADARGKSTVPGWHLPNAHELDPAVKNQVFWGAKRVDDKNALWIGTGAEAHIEPVWDLRVPVKGGAGYSAACLLRGKVDGEAMWAHGRIGVMFFDAAGKFLGHHGLGNIDVRKTPNQWQKCQGNFITPAGTASVGFRAGILSKGVKGFANYYWTDFELREIPEHPIAAEDAEALDPEKGKHIARTMAALATSTAKERKPVRLLFYGQSITAQPWSHEIAKRLRKKYFCADLSYENRAIGGFTAERLIKTAKQDLYPYYPDLIIFHVYGGMGGEWEAIIREIRKTTTAEILVFTHHPSHQGNKWVENNDDKGSQMIKEIANKYDCELVDVREEWQRHLKENNLQIKEMLRDDIHLNDRGCELMADLIWSHLQYNPAFENPHADWIKRIPVKPAADGSITVEFTGNRIDIVADVPVENMGTARLLIDGEPPSANPNAYTFTRPSVAPGAWWPAIYTIGSEHPMPQAETWTLTVTDVPEEGPFTFTVSGSKTGPDGTGNSAERFVSNSKRIVVEPGDWGIDAAEKYTKKKCPVGFTVKWQVEPMFTDTYVPPKNVDPALTTSTRVTQLIENGPHRLEIIPNGDGSVPVSAIIVYEPPLK